MKISVLIPFRSADPQRVALWNLLRPQWEALGPDIELCSTSDGGGLGDRFSFARGANRCRELATGDVLLVHGADQMLPDPATWQRIRATMAAAPWMWVYKETLEVDAWPTRLMLQGCSPAMVPMVGRLLDHCYAIYALRADVWDDVGGLDERLVGWGPEDAIMRRVLRAPYPDGVDQGEGVMRALWHEPAPRDRVPVNHGFYEETLTAADGGPEVLRRYLKEARGG